MILTASVMMMYYPIVTGPVNESPVSFAPAVHDAVWLLRPDFIALSIVARGGRNAPSEDRALEDLLAIDRHGAAWAEAHLNSWRDAYRAFGARPQRTPCSAEALRKRFEKDGVLPRVNAVVDLYNAVSVNFAVPVGGEDLSAYAGSPRLIRAAGDEMFATTRDGQPAVETVEAGEVVWRDDEGVTCRRWNWRQSPRTRLEASSTEMWFVLERLDPMPIDALVEAGDAIVAGLRRLAPDVVVETTLLRQP
jgi:DNA/RNA-binding domain of Phe-tRNA-synthetase-like protein